MARAASFRPSSRLAARLLAGVAVAAMSAAIGSQVALAQTTVSTAVTSTQAPTAGSLTVTSTGSITTSGATQSINVANNDRVLNYGTISQTGTGLTFSTNGRDGVNITNYGTISANDNQGIDQDNNITITNFGTITSGTGDGINVDDNANITNTGTITGNGDNGIQINNNGYITNSGTITGKDSAIAGDNNITITNSGFLIGLTDDGIDINGVATLYNSGTIRVTGTFAEGGGPDGVTITGGYVSNSGLIDSQGNGVIIAESLGGTGGTDTVKRQNAVATIINTGSIIAAQGAGIQMVDTNESGTTGFNDTIINSGYIRGGGRVVIVADTTAPFPAGGTDGNTVQDMPVAIDMGAGNDRLVLNTGSWIGGKIIMGAGTDRVEVNLGGGQRSAVFQFDSTAETIDTSGSTIPLIRAGDMLVAVNPGTFTGVSSSRRAQAAGIGRVLGSRLVEVRGTQVGTPGANAPRFAATGTYALEGMANLMSDVQASGGQGFKTALAEAGNPIFELGDRLAAAGQGEARLGAAVSGQAEGPGIWARGFGTYREEETSASGGLGYEMNAAGIVAGGDQKLDKDTTVGVVAAYAWSRTSQVENSGDSTLHSGYLGAYGVRSFGPLSVDGSAVLGIGRVKAERSVDAASGTLETAEGKYWAIQFTPQLGLAYDLAVGNGLTVTPGARMSYTLQHSTSYDETKTSTPLSVDASTSHSLRGELDVTVSAAFKQGEYAVSPFVRAGLVGVKPFGSSKTNMSAAGMSIGVDNDDRDYGGFAVGTGLSATGGGMSYLLGFDAEFGARGEQQYDLRIGGRYHL